MFGNFLHPCIGLQLGGLTAVLKKTQVYRHKAPCRTVNSCWRSKEACCLHHQGGRRPGTGRVSSRKVLKTEPYLCMNREDGPGLKQVMDIFNPLNADLNPTCHLLALLGTHHIFHFSRLRVNSPPKDRRTPPSQDTNFSAAVIFRTNYITDHSHILSNHAREWGQQDASKCL